MNILVTGSAGFIGFYVSKILLERGNNVIGVDNFYPYYDVTLKETRNAILEKYSNYKLYKIDISDLDSLREVFEENSIDRVCNLAAQAGVRFSLENPYIYGKSNLEGFINIINLTHEFNIKNFIYASSSSVYGNNTKYPYSESDTVNHPVSLYAATKAANELIAYSYNQTFKLKTIGLRFFTVYGPMGRPDMAYYKFTQKILSGQQIEVYNNGDMKRDFTYVDDIANGVVKAIDCDYDCEIFNLGNNKPENLGYMIELLEKYIGIEAVKVYLPMQKGDVLETYADVEKAENMLGYKPTTNLDEGLRKFIEWYTGYY
ncbi:MAG: NAD-dependent epimerase/dehydratase family protein [bacterium]